MRRFSEPRSAFDEVERVPLVCPQEEDRTSQEFKDETDINTLVKRFRLSGQMPTDVRMPTYGDFEGVSDFREAATAIAMARESFERMPAEVRARFQNDPAAFVDFCSDDRNRGEAVKLGLVPAKPPTKEAEVSASSSGQSTPAVPVDKPADGTVST